MRPILTLFLMLAAAPASAHHPLAGRPMESFGDGLLSGIGHPILGFDHLLFVLVMGVAARQARIPSRGALSYVAAMLIGCVLSAEGAALPLRELLIAVSLLTVGGLLASARRVEPGSLMLIFAAFGLFHGAAFGDTIAGQEGGAALPVLTGYLIGLALLQTGLAYLAGLSAMRLLYSGRITATGLRLTGAVAAGAGLVFALEWVEPPLLAFLTSG